MLQRPSSFNPSPFEPCSCPFYRTANRDQNYGTNKCHDDGTDHAASRPNPQKPENPTADNAPEDSEKDIHEYA
jgi:hypothetical protein